MITSVKQNYSTKKHNRDQLKSTAAVRSQGRADKERGYLLSIESGLDVADTPPTH